jgi:hypothetical protein
MVTHEDRFAGVGFLGLDFPGWIRYFDGKSTNRHPQECIDAQRCNVTTGSFAREVAIDDY